MKAEQISCHIVTEEPSLADNQVVSIPVEEGIKLSPTSPIERETQSLFPNYCRRYSRKQLRAIERRNNRFRDRRRGTGRIEYRSRRLSSNKFEYNALKTEMSFAAEELADGGKSH